MNDQDLDKNSKDKDQEIQITNLGSRLNAARAVIKGKITTNPGDQQQAFDLAPEQVGSWRFNALSETWRCGANTEMRFSF